MCVGLIILLIKILASIEQKIIMVILSICLTLIYKAQILKLYTYLNYISIYFILFCSLLHFNKLILTKYILKILFSYNFILIMSIKIRCMINHFVILIFHVDCK